MKLKFKYAEKFVGIFIFVAIFIVISSLLFLLISQKVFERKYLYKAKFGNAVGLSKNTPVFFKGFKIGSISGFSLTKDNFIMADIELYKEYKDLIVEESALFKSVNIITQSSVIEFLPGLSGGKIMLEGSIIPSIDVPEGKLLLAANKVKTEGDPLNSILVNVENLIGNLKNDNNPEQGAIFRALVNLADASEKLNKLAEYVGKDLEKLDGKNSGKGVISNTMTNLNDIIADLKTTTTLTNQLLKNADALLLSYSKPDSLGIKLIDPTGENILNPLKTTLNNVNEILPKLNKFSDYLNNQSTDITLVINELKLVLREVQTTFQSLNESPIIGADRDKVIPENNFINPIRTK